ncbi:hypothetical protein, partial [Vogesella sp. AC12]|uniref:hypothetical protein n=1 Tax=Vogesella sp. AC12 TaxID=2950550 RepID=UPI00210D0D01
PGLAGVSRGVGSPFLCLLSFGEAKESKPPPRGKRQFKQRRAAAHQTTPSPDAANLVGLRCASPTYLKT